MLKDDIVVNDSVLDVGCNVCLDLFNFEFTPFKSLLGVDNFPFKDRAIAYYDHYKRKLAESVGEEYLLTEEQVEMAFESKFQFCQKDIAKWTPEENKYSLIICSNVLHFFDDSVKFDIIERLHSALQPQGLLFIRINHDKHPDITIRHIDDERTQRYVNREKFIEQLSKFNILQRHLVPPKDNESTFIVVIRK